MTQKVRIANQRTMYVSVHEDPSRQRCSSGKATDCTPETVITAVNETVQNIVSGLLIKGNPRRAGGFPVKHLNASVCER